jgi:hypothetical protein
MGRNNRIVPRTSFSFTQPREFGEGRGEKGD